MSFFQPQGLLPGNTIAVVAPSAALAGDSPEKGIAYLHSLGYQVKLGRSVFAHAGYLAGNDELRAGDINEAFADETVKAILCLRGGYGATRLLPFLDYDLIAAHPKLFIGFSDITALHTVFRQRCGFLTVHGPMLMSLGRDASPYTKTIFQRGLVRPFEPYQVAMPQGKKLQTLVPGEVTGPLVGGNMMLLSVTLGTPYAINTAGAVLALEEVGEDAYALDRMLCQFTEAGLLEKVRGVVFGEFFGCEPTAGADYEWSVAEVLTTYAKKWGKPAIMGLPFGHGCDNAWLPLGQDVHLQAGAEPAFAFI